MVNFVELTKDISVSQIPQFISEAVVLETPDKC